MTERLYYRNSFLYDFAATVREVRDVDGRTAVVLNRTAFYPTSGGQIHDTGWLAPEPAAGQSATSLRVTEVVEEADGTILHVVDAPAELKRMSVVRGLIDVERRRDHMQQHSGQHVLSAAFVRLFNMPTVSFHMGDESCTIDLDTKALTEEQVRAAEAEANRAVLEDLPVEIRFAKPDEARAMGVRKIPADVHEELRLIDMKDYDLNACGGTHVRSTGQIGAILLRKVEKVKQGFRVEFVCGTRAVQTARRDYATLVEAAALFSTNIYDLPAMIRKSQDEVKAAAKARKSLMEELAEYQAKALVAEAETVDDVRLVARVFRDRELPDVKLLAQKISACGNAVALLGAGAGQAGVVFAQSAGLPFDMGALVKEALVELGGRGGGTRDLAQGGTAEASKLEGVIAQIAQKIRK